MIDPPMRNAIYQLHLAGVSQHQISRQLNISRHTAQQVIRLQGAMPRTVRRDKIDIDSELLRRLHEECDGWVQRMHEKLVEEHEIEVAYSTLTRKVRELGLGQRATEPCARVPDEAGAEMQHDTSVYDIPLSGKKTRLVASLLYLRYSKRRYLKFYRSFNRFRMKCFFHEALMFWGYSAKQCIIDNTNLARLRGSGSRAVMVPEMATFAQRYGFEFVCHGLGHSDRKAGEERSFWTVETSFLPGRCFENLEDLNEQASQWATVRMYHRPVSKTKLIPAKAFEHERGYLHELSAHLPAPYREEQRGTDQYGYVAFDGNYYWIPGGKSLDVKLLVYADHIEIYHQRDCLARYALPLDGVKNARVGPKGQALPRPMPQNRHGGSEPEEKRLRAMGSDVSAYVDYVLAAPGIQRHRLLRQHVCLSQKIPQELFVQAVARALRYRVTGFETLQRIAWFCLSQNGLDLPDVEIDEEYRQRAAYLEGYITDEPDLSRYDEPSPGTDDRDLPESEVGDVG